jgi:hypothetical protein
VITAHLLGHALAATKSVNEIKALAYVLLASARTVVTVNGAISSISTDKYTRLNCFLATYAKIPLLTRVTLIGISLLLKTCFSLYRSANGGVIRQANTNEHVRTPYAIVYLESNQTITVKLKYMRNLH